MLTPRSAEGVSTARKDVTATPPARCVHELFEEQVDRTPDRVAVMFDDRVVTYAELDRRANQVAHFILAQGVGPGGIVGICLEPSLEMVVGLLGTLKAGAAYVPLDPHYPVDRIEFMAADSEVPVVLTREDQAPSAVLDGRSVVRLDRADQIALESEARPGLLLDPESLAYLIYTSGSTGRPKGVQVPHRAVANLLTGIAREPGLTAADVVLAVTTLSFDTSVIDLFLPLTVGARLVVASRQEVSDGRALRSRLEESQATFMQATPATWRLLLEAGWSGTPGLRVVSTGEALQRDLADRLLDRAAEVWNMYGPTEITVWCTGWRVEAGGGPILIGRPIDNTGAYVLDGDGRRVAAGETGELCIGGAGVTHGYWRRPELTAERFVEDPFSPGGQGRMYRTGDLARVHEDGNIECLGRLDNQIKVRGFRIEPGEIETVLAEHPGVYQAVVAAHEYGPGDRRLVAYIVPDPQTVRTGLVTDVRSLLQRKLPDHMVPAAFELLDAMPLAPNGKLDRKALPAPSHKRPELGQAFAPPRTGLERYLTALWTRILKLDAVGIHDRFFELGGDSIQAAMFINELQQDLGESIYVVTLFDAPTIAGYAAFLQRDYPEALKRKFGAQAVATGAHGAAEVRASSNGRLDAALLEALRRSVPALSTGEDAGRGDEAKNPPAIFILAPPRSGTTLLRVMLAGHPRLFAASELQLLGFHTLAERKAALTGKYAIWLEGTIRALMEIEGCDADEAKRIMHGYEAEGLTTKEFYRLLQSRIGERILVDKSPSYALDPETLRKAERDFDGAIFIHLVRHPYAMARSFENMHMDQVMFLREHPLSARQLGEAIWTLSHRNIVEFLEHVPVGRKFRLAFEDLTHEPGPTMTALCEAVGLEFHPSLIQPYEDREKKMTDGIYAESTPMGDIRFLQHGAIDPTVADRWKDVAFDDFLGDVTWETAAALGYSVPTGQARNDRESRQERMLRRRESRASARADRSGGRP